MSSPIQVFHFACDRCSYARQLEAPRRFYRFGGRDVEIVRAPAWCTAEQDVVEAEVLPTRHEVDETLATLEREAARVGHDEELDLDDWRARQRFVVERRTRAKCLSCGSTELDQMVELDAGGYGIRHPACGGAIRVVNMDARNVDDAVRFYDREGNALR